MSYSRGYYVYTDNLLKTNLTLGGPWPGGSLLDIASGSHLMDSNALGEIHFATTLFSN